MPTIKDIAKAAGVSHSTVSNVLNKKAGVSSEKIRLVQETARAMGYRIDEQASLLRKGVTRTVAVILPDIRSARYCDLYVGILRSLENRNYSARLFLTENMPYLEKRAINGAIAAKACAVLAVTCLKNAHSRYSVPSLAQVPVLFLDRRLPEEDSPCFDFSYRRAGQYIASRARHSGCLRPGIYLENCDYASNRDFLKGVREVYPELPDEHIVEMKLGEISPDAYLPFTGVQDFDSYITFCAEIAGQLYNAFNAVGFGPEPSIYTLASLRSIQDGRFNNLALNYSRLGADGADTLLDAVENRAVAVSRQLDDFQFQPLRRKVPPSGEEPLRVLSLASPTAAALNCLLPNFTGQTGIRVELETYPLNTIYSHILSGQPMNWDVIRLDVSCFDFMAPQILEPLTNIDGEAERQFKRFIPGLSKDYSYVDDTLYALPFDISMQLLFYRRDLFEDAMQMRSFFEATKHSLKIPETFEEYNEIARFFTRKFRPDSPTSYGSSIALGTASSTASEYLVRLLGMGGGVFDENGLLHISTPKAKKALKSYLETAAYADPKVIHSWSSVSDNFVHGETAMAILFSNHASGLIRAQNALSVGQVGFAPVPGSRPLLGGGALGVCRDSGQKENAYRFIQWATGEDIASRLMIMGGISPCRSAYEQVEILNAYPWLRDFGRNLNMGSRKTILSRQGVHLDLHKFEVDLGQLVIDAANKKRPVNETIWRAQQLIDAMI